MGEGRRWLAEALAASEGVRPATLAKAHFAAGYAALGEGDFVPAKRGVRAQPRARAGGGRRAAPRRQRSPSSPGSRCRRDEYDGASELAGKSTELATSGGRQADCLGRAEHPRGDRRSQTARRRSDRALRARPGAAPRARRQAARRELAPRPRSRRAPEEDYPRATALLEEALALARQVKDTWIISVALGNLARVQLCTGGDRGRVASLLAEGLRLARERNDRRLSAEWAQALAAAYALDGRAEDAGRLCAAAEALRETTGAELYPAEAMIQERFLTAVRADRRFPQTLGTARALSADELIAQRPKPRSTAPARRQLPSPAVPTYVSSPAALSLAPREAGSLLARF